MASPNIGSKAARSTRSRTTAQEEQRAAFNGGDLERLAWLRTPAAAEAAIEEAARQARLADFGALAHKGLGRDGFEESEARKRAEFDNFARRSGLVS